MYKKLFHSEQGGLSKVSIIILMALITLFSQQLFAADNLNFQVKNMTLREAVLKLQQVHGFSITIKSDEVNLDHRVTISLKNESVNTVLKYIFEGQNVSYSVDGKNITVTSKPKENGSSNAKPQMKVTGQVISEDDDEPIIGAVIRNKTSNKGTITDIDGLFSIEAAVDEILIISYIGFGEMEVAVPKSGNMLVKMSGGDQQLEELVVVGFGTQKKVNLTGAVAVIDSEEINGRPVVSAAQALQGLDPSLNISMSSGVANSGFNIDIRGVSSLNGGTPLILVDGIEMDLSRINPNDIESVSILKDASAAAVYGAKASSGVVLVTTKTGKDSKTVVSYNGRYGLVKNTANTDYITTGYDWVKTTDLFMRNSKGYGYTTYDEADYEQLYIRRNDKTENPDRPWTVVQNDGTYKYYANFDWYGYLFKRTRHQQEHNISISGGNDKVNYYVSGRYYNTQGMMNTQNDPFDSYNIRSRINVKIRPWLRYSNNLSYYYGEMWWPGMKSPQTTFRNTTYGGGAYIPATNPDGSIVHLQTYTNQSAAVLGGMNLILTYGKSSNKDIQNDFTMKNNLEVDLLKGLTLNLSHAYRYSHSFNQYRYTNAPYSQKEGVIEWNTQTYCRNDLTEINNSLFKHTFEAFADYTHSFNKDHNFKIVGGIQYDTRYYRENSVTVDGILSEDLNDFNLASGSTYTVKGGQSKYNTLGIFGRINYDYLGKYLIEVSGRGDGTSRFWSKDRWSFFPSTSAGWRVSEESFWKSLESWWSNAKVRASLGSLGNQQVADYLFIQKINTKRTNSDYTLNGVDILTYAREDAPVAGDLTWETVTTYDVGIDLGFLKNRLSFSGDYYIRDTRDMMMPGASLPAVYGTSEPRMNAADMRTNGWEISLAWRDKTQLLGKSFSYGVRANLGDYKTKITRFDNETGIIDDPYKGQILGEIWGFKTDGLFVSDEEAANYPVDCSLLTKRINVAPGENKGLRAGDVKFLDLDGDNKLTIGKNTVSDPGDRVAIGNSLPRYSYSFGGDFTWNGFDFSILFQGIGRQHWYPGSGESNLFWGPYCRPHNTFLSQQLIDNMWSEENPDAYFPRPRGYEAYSDNTVSYYTLTTPNDRYLQNIAYLRLKNLNVGYTLPILQKCFQQIRVYFSGENLAYWSPLKKYNKYIDPEGAKATGTYREGSGEAYGFSKVFSFGVDIKF